MDNQKDNAVILTNPGLSVKRANLFFLCYTILSMLLGSLKIPGLPTSWIRLIYDIPTVALALLLCRKEKTRLKTAFGFHRVGLLTVLLTVVIFLLTDSVWPGVLFHFLNNGMAPVAEAVSERYGEEFVSRYLFPFSRGLSDPKSTLVTISAAMVGSVIVILCLRGIARREGNEDRLRLFLRGGGGTERLFTPALIVAIVLTAGMTAIVTVALVKKSLYAG